jgi:hypothetical protein
MLEAIDPKKVHKPVLRRAPVVMGFAFGLRSCLPHFVQNKPSHQAINGFDSIRAGAIISLAPRNCFGDWATPRWLWRGTLFDEVGEGRSDPPLTATPGRNKHIGAAA